LHVVVCTKPTPDTTANLAVDASGAVTWGDLKPVTNPWDEYAIEEALLLKEQHGAKKTTVLCVGVNSMGATPNKDVLKDAVARGIESAQLIWDDALAGSDSLATARVLAAGIKKLGDVSVALFGRQAIDGDSGHTAVQVARVLGWNALTFVAKIRAIDFAAGTVTVERLLEQGRQVVTTKLPVVIAVVKEINEPRYPTFMGIRKASKLDVPTWSLADLGVAAGQVGAAGSGVRWPSVRPLPPRAGTVTMIEGATPEEQAKNLVDRLIADKVV
jgi:electron transfer flavoprotein beta subunit